MNRVQKITLLKSWNIAIPANSTNEQLDALISQHRKEKRSLNFKGGSMTVTFDKADETPVELMIYEDIGDDPWSAGGFTAKDFVDALKDIKSTRALDIRINSAGGSVWEGLAIKTRIDEWKGKKTASIDGMAASVASWLPMSVDEIRAPKHSQMFIHDAWGMTMGNAADMRTSANELDKTSDQIAEMYANRTGMSQTECRDLMKTGTLMTGEEALKMGFIDRLTDDEPVSNFTEKQISNMRSKLAVLNSIKPAQQGGTTKNQTNKMNRKQKIALLNKLGVSVSKNAHESVVDALLTTVRNSFPQNAAKFKNGKDGDHSEDCDCADCAMKNAPEPDAEDPDADADDGAPGKEGELFKAATENKATLKLMKNFLERQRNKTIEEKMMKYVEEGRIGGNDVSDWMNLAIAATEDAKGNNPILNQLEKLPVRLPGRDALNLEVVSDNEAETIPGLERICNNLRAPQNYYNRNGTKAENLHERMVIAQNSKQIARHIGRLKQFDKTGELIGPIRQAWDKFEMGSPRNANTMTTGLLRQVILSEIMRAFRRAFTPLTYFAHNFGNVPLEGTDVVQVPYYPLATQQSTEFLYANGYQITANAQTLSKNITVGGIGNGVATPGSGRKYQPLQFTAYEIRRQPWLDIQKLSVMAGEQLALDVRADIIGTQICAANFGNAVWTGQPGGFDHTIIGGTLMLAANNAFWPKRGRNVVVGTAYHANASIDNGLYPYLYSGSTAILDQAEIKNKYRFENITEDPILPIGNYIQGGSGNVVPGLDPYLAGYMCWPSAVLIATAPIMPSPGVLKKLLAYEQITDDQTDLTFSYRFMGAELNDADQEVIESAYGSGPGELKALFRLASQGN
jgi:ATP-dependent protease ClpP protease subunit